MSRALADSAMSWDADSEPLSEVDEFLAKDSASVMISFAEAMSASRSSKAEPMTASFFWRSSRPRRSRPAMPADLARVGGG